jgi:hypothetical protein
MLKEQFIGFGSHHIPGVTIRATSRNEVGVWGRESAPAAALEGGARVTCRLLVEIGSVGRPRHSVKGLLVERCSEKLPPRYYLLDEAVRIEFVVEVYELKEVTHRGEHALSDMVSAWKKQVKSISSKLQKALCAPSYLGCLSASRATTSMPSRAKAAAANDPAGPPPTTSTVQLSGTDMLSVMEM